MYKGKSAIFTKPRKTEMSLVDLDILETSKYSSMHFFFYKVLSDLLLGYKNIVCALPPSGREFRQLLKARGASPSGTNREWTEKNNRRAIRRNQERSRYENVDWRAHSPRVGHARHSELPSSQSKKGNGVSYLEHCL